MSRAIIAGIWVAFFQKVSAIIAWTGQTGRDGWVAGCSGGAGVFGIIKDPDYKTSYQFAWPSLLVAGLSAEPACSKRLPCIE